MDDQLIELQKQAQLAVDELDFCKSSWYTKGSLHSGDHGVLEEHYDYVAATNPRLILKLLKHYKDNPPKEDQ